MKAFILAAGYGKRLKPITSDIPKALVEVQGIPMIEIVVERLKKHGIKEIIINLHHHGNKIEEFIKHKNYFGIDIKFSYEEELLDTGGALKHAKKFLNNGTSVLLHNVDILSDINLTKFIDKFENKNTDVLLAVKKRKTTRYFLFDNNLRLQGWTNVKTNEKILSKNFLHSKKLTPLAFSGIHILNSKALGYLFEYPQDKFSITKFYLENINKLKIYGYDHSKNFVLDLGKVETLELANYLDLKKFL